MAVSVQEKAQAALGAAGIDAPRDLAVRKLGASTLSETYRLVARDVDCVLKVHPHDLGLLMPADRDSRFHTAARALRIPPYFSTSASRTEAARAAINVLVPQVLAEGTAADGSRWTLMTRVPGTPFHPRFASTPARRRELAEQLGALVRRLHGATPPADALGDDLASNPRAHAEILFAVVDHLPALVVGGRKNRAILYRRAERILSRLESIDPGPPVLVHGDIHLANLLFDEDGEPSGLLDFSLSTVGPRALDFRALPTFDPLAFLRGYGLERRFEDECQWLGMFYEMLWEGLAMTTTARYLPAKPDAAYWIAYGREFHYNVRVLEDDALRTGPASKRLEARKEIDRRVGVLVAEGMRRGAAAGERG